VNEPPDDLDELLRPRSPAASSAFREELLLRTQRRLACDRWLRRGARAIAVAGLFAVGGLAGWVARPERERIIESPGAAQTVFVPVAVPVPLSESSPAVTAPASLSASSAELQAEQQDNAAAAATLYRQAGDRFLRDQDYPNATRCYRLYLARAGDHSLALDTNDSWLLVSLKNAAYREKVDATKNDG